MFPKNIITGLLAVSFILLFCSVDSRSFYYLKRGGTDVGCRLQPGKARNINLNNYLNQMVRCLASVARPRFGKRNGNVIGGTMANEENVGATPFIQLPNN